MRLINLNLQLALFTFALKVHLIVLALVKGKTIIRFALLGFERGLAETFNWALGELRVEVGHV